jgi:hypothetical protein
MILSWAGVATPPRHHCGQLPALLPWEQGQSNDPMLSLGLMQRSLETGA